MSKTSFACPVCGTPRTPETTRTSSGYTECRICLRARKRAYRAKQREANPRRVPTIAERFWSKVDKNGPLPIERPDLGPCWLWRGHDGLNSYGRFHPEPTTSTCAHIWAYVEAHGPVPPGLVLDHLCRTPSCVNPAHLEPVTQRINVLRGRSHIAENARKTHCKHGHEFTPDNTRVTREGYRRCRECQSLRNRITDAMRRQHYRTINGKRVPRELVTILTENLAAWQATA